MTEKEEIKDIWDFRMTLLRLLFIIATKRLMEIDGNQRAYLHRLKKGLFEND